jgi:anti-anti-sigma regulatory factor/anti-sigma regulatory factor (Ser/Thr protein kinase)
MIARVDRVLAPDPAMAVIRVAGVLDPATAARLRTMMLKCLAEQPDAIIVDVAGLTVVDDMQLTVFAAMGRHAAAWPGIPLLLCHADQYIDGGLTALGFDRFVTTTATLEDAYARAVRKEPVNRLRETLAPVPASTSAARELVTDVCRRSGVPHLVPDACLVITELVANVVRHAGTTMDLTVQRRSRYLHVSVRDYDHHPARLVGPVAAHEPGGRGLLIVEAFSSNWGCVPTTDGKVTWASFPAHRGHR